MKKSSQKFGPSQKVKLSVHSICSSNIHVSQISSVVSLKPILMSSASFETSVSLLPLPTWPKYNLLLLNRVTILYIYIYLYWTHLSVGYLILLCVCSLKGSMMAPHYNSKAMKIAVVVDGEGGFQMACPHLSSSSGRSGRWSERERQQKGERSYQKIRGRLRRGVVFVVPAGHPFSVFASPNHSLQIVCFEVNAYGNTKYLLAGIKSIWSTDF